MHRMGLVLILITPWLPGLCSATDLRDHLVGVQHSTVHVSLPPRFQQVQGSGICINPSCSVVATAYHIQMMVGRANLRVGNDHTVKVLSLANESDTDKSDVLVGKKTLSYNVANDISFVYTKKPTPRKSGVSYTYKSYVGQKVTIAGYYKDKFETQEARIIGTNVPLAMGQAQLNEDLILDVRLKPGTSGSAVLDERGNLLGMIILSGVLKVGNGDLTATIALPVIAIAKALVKLDPVLGAAIFRDIPEEEPQAAQATSALFQESDLPEDASPVIPELSAVPSEVSNPVGRLRAKSEAASTLMVNFVTKQCLVQGTQKSICHELSIVDGQQTFREINKDGKLGKLTDSFPIQKHGVWMQTDWTDTLGAIADNLWVFQGAVGEGYLFTFKSVAEDDRCYFEEYSQGNPLLGGGHANWKGPVVCFEQVVTDKDFNVLSVFTEMLPPEGCRTQIVQMAIYYDWVKLEELTSPVRLPVMERITAKQVGQKNMSYASVSWTDYQKFRAEHRIKF
jgi:Trypsin-like peptidase domain